MKGADPMAWGNRAARRDALRIRNSQIVYEKRDWMPAMQPTAMTTEPLRTQIYVSLIDKCDPRSKSENDYLMNNPCNQEKLM